MRELYEDYWKLYLKLKHTYQREYLYSKLEDNIVRYSIFMKNPLFEHENEYRIIIFTQNYIVEIIVEQG